MIPEDQQDQAALYALGLLDDDERAEFAGGLTADSELRALVDELRESAASLALAAVPALSATPEPSEALKAQLLARVEREKMAALPSGNGARSGWSTWAPWAIAAAAMLAAVLALLNSVRQQDQLLRARAVNGALRSAAHQQGLTIQQLDDARERDVLARQQASPLRQVAVSQLEPTPDGPAQPRATVVWDPSRREGQLIVTQLKPPKESHDYQLWVVEAGNKEPVSAGLVRVNAEGRATVDFKPADPGTAKVGAFALSLEKAGGSEKNQGPILLLGKL